MIPYSLRAVIVTQMGVLPPRSQQQEKLKSYKAYFIDGVVSILLCISVHLESYGTEVKVSVEQKCVL